MDRELQDIAKYMDIEKLKELRELELQRDLYEIENFGSDIYAEEWFGDHFS